MAEALTESEDYSKTIFGFWVYLMTDCILFGILFATYIVLHDNTWGGPSSHDLFNLPFALAETLLLLTSTFTCSMSSIAASRQNKKQVMFWFALTFLLGLSFLALELHEFFHLALEGNSWQRSAFLSSYFTLVGTHGAHITVGLIWMIGLVPQVWIRGFTPYAVKRLKCLRMFWHFLDVIWIFIFTIVYLMGVA